MKQAVIAKIKYAKWLSIRAQTDTERQLTLDDPFYLLLAHHHRRTTLAEEAVVFQQQSMPQNANTHTFGCSDLLTHTRTYKCEFARACH